MSGIHVAKGVFRDAYGYCHLSGQEIFSVGHKAVM